jgi:hypothetical protein
MCSTVTVRYFDSSITYFIVSFYEISAGIQTKAKFHDTGPNKNGLQKTAIYLQLPQRGREKLKYIYNVLV